MILGEKEGLTAMLVFIVFLKMFASPAAASWLEPIMTLIWIWF